MLTALREHGFSVSGRDGLAQEEQPPHAHVNRASRAPGKPPVALHLCHYYCRTSHTFTPTAG
jgi:hypothetical protein